MGSDFTDSCRWPVRMVYPCLASSDSKLQANGKRHRMSLAFQCIDHSRDQIADWLDMSIVVA